MTRIGQSADSGVASQIGANEPIQVDSSTTSGLGALQRRRLVVGDGGDLQGLQSGVKPPATDDNRVFDAFDVVACDSNSEAETEEEITDSDSFTFSESQWDPDALSDTVEWSDQVVVSEDGVPGEAPNRRSADFMQGMLMGATLASVFGGNLSPAQARAVLSPAEKSASDLALEKGIRLQGQINQLMSKLDVQLRRMGGGELAREPEAGQLDGVTLTTWDHLSRYGHQLKGMFSATVETVGWTTAAAALPTVTGLVTSPLGWTPTAIGANVVATGAGAFMGLSALRDFPALSTDKAALSLLESEMAKIQPLFGQLNELIAQEQSRQVSATRTMVISVERHQVMSELQREIAHVDRAIDDATLGVEVKSLSVFLGEGTLRGEIMGWLGRAKSAFQSVFASIASTWSSLTNYVANLPGLFVSDRPRSEARRSESDYSAAFKSALRILGTQSKFSAIKQGADIRFMMDAGYSKEEMTEALTAVRRQLNTGENLMRLIKQSESEAFGAVIISSNEAPPTRYVAPSSLTLSRALAAYFSVQANDKVDPAVVRNRDGSLSVADPGGRLFNFLMSTPSAYTSTMANSRDPGTRTRLTIDDHSKGFPGGASSMQFEHVLKLDEDGQPVLDVHKQPVSELRLHFLEEQPQPVYAPLANEGKVLRSIYVETQVVLEEQRRGLSVAGGASANSDYSSWTVDDLRDHKEALERQLAQEEMLLQVDQDRFGSLQNWQHPLAQPSV